MDWTGPDLAEGLVVADVGYLLIFLCGRRGAVLGVRCKV